MLGKQVRLEFNSSWWRLALVLCVCVCVCTRLCGVFVMRPGDNLYVQLVLMFEVSNRLGFTQILWQKSAGRPLCLPVFPFLRGNK